jgi:hypothetical protein
MQVKISKVDETNTQFEFSCLLDDDTFFCQIYDVDNPAYGNSINFSVDDVRYLVQFLAAELKSYESHKKTNVNEFL